MLNIEDRTAWATLRQFDARRAPFAASAAADDVAAWIHSIYIRTERDSQVAQAIRRTMRRNGATKRHWLALDGPAALGKTELLLRFAIDFDEEERQRAGEGGGRQSHFAHVPVIYVQADSGQQGAGLLRAISDFAGIPATGNEDQLRRRLAQLLPRLGTRLVITDDAHMFRRASHRATRLPDSLRATLRLPVTLVFAGADMRHSALLDSAGGQGYESTDQLRARHSFLPLSPMAMPDDAAIYRDLLGQYLRTIHRVLPQVETPFRTDNAGLAELLKRAGGLTGAVMGALKDATIDAVLDDVPLTTERLLACVSSRSDVN